MKNLRITIVVLLLAATCAAACTGPRPAATPQPQPTWPPAPVLAQTPGSIAAAPAAEPYWPTRGWRASTPEQQGMDSALLLQMLETVLARKLGLHSLLIIRHGYLVAEVYYGANSPALKHDLYSVTKSFTSALVGIAIHRGHIAGVSQPVLDLFAERQVANVDARKKAMTLEHLLTMSSGLDWPESSSPYTTTANPYVGMLRSPNWVQFVLDRPMAQPPGAVFNYNSGASHLLSAIVQKTSGTSTLAFAREHLFQPLGIADVDWGADPSGIAVGGSDLRLTPRDMAKLGYLYLRGGVWDGQQIVPAEWVKTSTSKHITSGNAALDYGYQWWIWPDGFAAQGLGGQYVFVRPRHDLVVVFTAWLTGNETEGPPALLDAFILPAIRSEQPLPENPAALAKLKAHIESVRNR